MTKIICYYKLSSSGWQTERVVDLILCKDEHGFDGGEIDCNLAIFLEQGFDEGEIHCSLAIFMEHGFDGRKIHCNLAIFFNFLQVHSCTYVQVMKSWNNQGCLATYAYTQGPRRSVRIIGCLDN